MGLICKGLGHRFWLALVAMGAVGGFALASTAEVRAQEPMTSGILDHVSLEDGTIRLRADQIASRPLIFYGMNAANFMTVSGRLARLEDLAPGMSVSLFFARHGKRGWIISRVVIADEDLRCAPLNRPPVIYPPLIAAPLWWGLRVTRADIDGDPTTHGPDRAYLEPDRTRVPAQGSRGGLHRR